MRIYSFFPLRVNTMAERLQVTNDGGAGDSRSEFIRAYSHGLVSETAHTFQAPAPNETPAQALFPIIQRYVDLMLVLVLSV